MLFYHSDNKKITITELKKRNKFLKFFRKTKKGIVAFYNEIAAKNYDLLRKKKEGEHHTYYVVLRKSDGITDKCELTDYELFTYIMLEASIFLDRNDAIEHLKNAERAHSEIYDSAPDFYIRECHSC